MVAKYLALASVAHLGVTTVWLDLDVFVLTDPSSFVFEELGNTSEPWRACLSWSGVNSLIFRSHHVVLRRSLRAVGWFCHSCWVFLQDVPVFCAATDPKRGLQDKVPKPTPIGFACMTWKVPSTPWKSTPARLGPPWPALHLASPCAVAYDLLCTPCGCERESSSTFAWKPGRAWGPSKRPDDATPNLVDPVSQHIRARTHRRISCRSRQTCSI